MAASIFDLPNLEPNEVMTSGVLGESTPLLKEICNFIEREFDQFSKQWRYYGKQSGWVLKLFHKKRNLLFVIPRDGYFRVSFTFSEAAVMEVLQHELPGFNKQELLDAKKYAEGRTIQYEIKTREDCENVLILIRIKMQH